jgi:hypothetical protein
VHDAVVVDVVLEVVFELCDEAVLDQRHGRGVHAGFALLEAAMIRE